MAVDRAVAPQGDRLPRRAAPPVPNVGRSALHVGDRGLSAFSPIRTRRASDVVLAVLVDAIRGGLYEPGDALPAERDLADRLDVSRKVLREAIVRLRNEGIVSVRRGSGGGTVVQSLENLASVSASIEGETRTNLRSLLEVRRPLECTAALLAAKRATRADHERLRRLVGMLDDLVEMPKDFWEMDVRFHFTIADISQNAYCAEIVRATFNRMAAIRAQFPYAHVPHEQAIVNQQTTLEAMETRDPALVLASIDEHLASLESVLLGARLPGRDGHDSSLMFGMTVTAD